MAGPFLDRVRAGRLLREAGLDALVLCAPDAFAYATGGQAGVAALFGWAGAAFAVVPADAALPLGAVVGDQQAAAFMAASPVSDVRTHPLSIETATLGEGASVAAAIEAGWLDRPAGFARPATFDLALAAAELCEVLTARGLRSGRLGFDLGFVPAADRDALVDMLMPAHILDGSNVLRRLQAIKHPDEVARLALAAELSAAGLTALAEAISEGADAETLRAAYRAGVAAAAQGRGLPPPPSWEYIGVGPDPWTPGGIVTRGAVVKADVGVVIDGYSSDTSRNYVFGEPSPEVTQLHAIVEAAFEVALAAMRVGAPLSEIHAAATRSLRDAGLVRFSRGHFGHGLGAGPFSEQWPFISADSTETVKPGMVLALEVPIYVQGLCGFNLEDQFNVTADGVMPMTSLPRGLRRIGTR